jgi:hypothetical protein
VKLLVTGDSIHRSPITLGEFLGSPMGAHNPRLSADDFRTDADNPRTGADDPGMSAVDAKAAADTIRMRVEMPSHECRASSQVRRQTSHHN